MVVAKRQIGETLVERKLVTSDEFNRTIMEHEKNGESPGSALIRMGYIVGEIRDPGTADIIIQAALTGHLVFSSLYINDAPSTATRLIHMVIQSYLIVS